MALSLTRRNVNNVKRLMLCAVGEKIRGWNVRAVCVPLPVPHRTSSGVIADSARLLCLLPTARWLEYIDRLNPTLREPLELLDGLTRVNDAAGSGLDWDENVIERLLASL